MPHPRSGSSIVSRLMLGVALIALLSFGVTAAISYWKSSHALLASSQDTMRNLAGLEAQRVSAELGEAYDTANTLATTLRLQHQQGILTRPGVSALLKQQLLAHPEWVGVSTLWEPEAFDGADAEHVGDEAHDESGRFMSYWAWADGKPITEALRGFDVAGDGDWYLKPRESRQPTLVEPYSYAINGKQILMTTLSMPIVEEGRFLGVVTVDFALSSLQEHLARLSPMGEGHVELLSPAGRILASRDPAVAPLIDLNFLAEAEDRARLLEGVKLARRIGRSEPLAGLIHAELGPGPEARSDAQIEAAIRATLDTYHHPTSSAPMGRAGERWAVVDLEGRVHGLQGLRVIDASIFPDAISVATNITTIAVAEHLAQRIA